MENSRASSMSCCITQLCESTVLCRVWEVGMRMILAWNSHSIPRCGIPNTLQTQAFNTVHIHPSEVPQCSDAVAKYRRQGGDLLILAVLEMILWKTLCGEVAHTVWICWRYLLWYDLRKHTSSLECYLKVYWTHLSIATTVNITVQVNTIPYHECCEQTTIPPVCFCMWLDSDLYILTYWNEYPASVHAIQQCMSD